MTDGTYAYSPLASTTTIRLLHLHPGTTDDPLVGELYHIELCRIEESFLRPHEEADRSNIRGPGQTGARALTSAQKQPLRSALKRREAAPTVFEDWAHQERHTSFEAISYVWGALDFTCTIKSSSGDICITPNLDETLRGIRLLDHTRVLWADGVCINQRDVKERGHQVALMGEIYSKARNVLIWLGADRQGLACDAFAKVIDERTADEAVRTITKASWFSRLWVIQELLLAQRATFLWGTEQMEAEELQRRIRCSDVKRETGDNYGWTTTSAHLMNILDVFVWIRALQCSDGRDRIYAIQGLRYNPLSLISTKISSLKPDYTKTETELFSEVACIFVESDRIPEMLSFVNTSAEKDGRLYGLPSWAPDWSYVDDFSPLHSSDWRTPESAVTLSFERPVISPDRRVLTLPGFGSDSITYVQSDTLRSSSWATTSKAIVEFWFRHVDPWRECMTALDYARLELHFFQALAGRRECTQWKYRSKNLITWIRGTGGGDVNTWRGPARSRMLRSMELSDRLCGSTETDDDYSPDLERHHWDHRKLFCTSDGYIGLGPAAMLASDTVAILSQCKYPAVVRRQEEKWRFVGLAYIAAYSKDKIQRLWKARDQTVDHFEFR